MSEQTIDLAFWGRVSTEDNQDSESSRGWQLTRAKALVEPHGGRIVAEFFDVDKSRSIPPQRRPEASRLLAALADPRRGFDAVVVGEPQRAFYGNQFGNTFPIFAHYKVPLWVPEVGGPIDPENEAHDLIMSVFGGVSKGERNRVKIRVRTAMAAQAQLEGRFLGGRPPYGYRLIDAGPHPNPAKAADGKRLHALALDETAAPVVERIFAEFAAGHGLYAIAEHLTREGIPCPSAHDPDRNTHRCGIAWSKSAIRVIITNPRYTGRQVWNKQRKDEVLIDVRDVALGHTTKMRWNDQAAWVQSDEISHPAIVSQDTFAQVQQLLISRRTRTGPRERISTRHVYALAGQVVCDACDRKMQASRANGYVYYRCRFAAEYAIANKVSHPRNILIREAELVPALDQWLASQFEPDLIEVTIDVLTAAQDDPADEQQTVVQARHVIRDCEAKMARYQAAIDAGGDIQEISQWINATKAERLAAEAMVRTSRKVPGRMTRDEVAALVHRTGSVTAALRDADLEDKAALYKGLNLRLIYEHATRTIRAEVQLHACPFWDKVRVRGGT